MILAGDVGGTKTVLGLFEPGPDGLRCVQEERLASAFEVPLEEVVAGFLESNGGPRIDAACIGFAGPVIDGRVRGTNLPGELSEDSLARATGAPRVELLNDLQASAWGMLHLDASCFEVLNEGVVVEGHKAVVAPGTGLGEGLLFYDGVRYHPIATEGGHASFAPQDETQIGLLRFLRELHGGHVSTERVLSGPGLFDLYRFLRETTGEPEPPTLTSALASGDPPAVVAEAGLAGSDPVCVRALEVFAAVLGAEAGNMALRTLTWGGIYLAGGIPPKILPALRGPAFLEAYLDKGRFRTLLEALRISLCLEPRAPLLGAAHRAHGHLGTP